MLNKIAISKYWSDGLGKKSAWDPIFRLAILQYFCSFKKVNITFDIRSSESFPDLPELVVQYDRPLEKNKIKRIRDFAFGIKFRI